MRMLWQDVRYGLRMLAKSPGFTTVSIISLALGIGAGTAVFSLVNGILLRSLPVPNPHELRELQWTGVEPRIRSHSGNVTRMGNCLIGSSVSYSLFLGLRGQGVGQADIFAFCPLEETVIRERNGTFLASGMMVSDNFFSALGLQPSIGRLLNAGEDYAGDSTNVVISYGWWDRHFALDPGVLGQAITLNGTSFTIIGVLPRGFAGVQSGDPSEFYVPLAATSPFSATRIAEVGNWFVRLMARLKPGVRDSRLKTVLDAAFVQEAGAVMKEPRMLVKPGHGGLAYDRNNYRKPLLLMLGVVGMVMVVACANLAGLSLSRGEARQHELAVRAALGAGRWRLVRQSFTESLLLALFGGGLGVLLAVSGKAVISRFVAGSAAGLRYDLSLDVTVLGFSLAASLVTALLSGFLPALRAGLVDPVGGFKSRGATGKPHLWTGKALVAVQVCLSFLLLTGAGLYVRTLVNLSRIDAGFNTEKLLLFQLTPGSTGYDGDRQDAFYEQVQNSLAAIPGVKGAALLHNPLIANRYDYGRFAFRDRPASSQEDTAYRLIVSETFFATLGMPVLSGRGLSVTDSKDAPKVVVVNEAFVREYLHDENPLGLTINVWDADWQIVGVCRDARYKSIKDAAPPTVYLSFRQYSRGDTWFAVRTAFPPLSVATAARKAVAAIDPDLPLANITTQETLRDRTISQERVVGVLCSGLAGLTLLLACIGLYGLMAYRVGRRISEIAIRMSLGATRRRIAGSIVRETLLLVAIGISVGLPAVLAVTRFIKSQLYGVAPHDPFSLAVSTLLLLAVAALAAWLPARRAARIDPMAALRCE
ncbi:MAG: ABC transporter permease [Phycisphaerales bacterium]